MYLDARGGVVSYALNKTYNFYKRITYLWWTKESMQCRLVVQFHSVPMCSSCNVKYPNMIPTDVLESCYRKEFYFVRDNKGVKFDYGKTWKQIAMNNSFWPRFLSTSDKYQVCCSAKNRKWFKTSRIVVYLAAHKRIDKMNKSMQVFLKINIFSMYISTRIVNVSVNAVHLTATIMN